MELSTAHLRYLTIIYEISLEKEKTGVIDIAARLNVTKPSATSMLKVLMAKGLLVRERYGKVYLTSIGMTIVLNYFRIADIFKDNFPDIGQPITQSERDEIVYAAVSALPLRCLLPNGDLLLSENGISLQEK